MSYIQRCLNFVNPLNWVIVRVIRWEIIRQDSEAIIFSTYNKYCDFNQEMEYQSHYYNSVKLNKVVEEITFKKLISKYKNLKRV